MDFSRRAFLKTTAATLASLPILGGLLSLDAGAAELPMLSDEADAAKSLKYCANAAKPSKRCEGRKHKDKAEQFCYNCQLYTKLEGEKAAGKGKCMLLSKNRVSGGGWCMSWVKNPAVSG